LRAPKYLSIDDDDNNEEEDDDEEVVEEMRPPRRSGSRGVAESFPAADDDAAAEASFSRARLPRLWSTSWQYCMVTPWGKGQENVRRSVDTWMGHWRESIWSKYACSQNIFQVSANPRTSFFVSVAPIAVGTSLTLGDMGETGVLRLDTGCLGDASGGGEAAWVRAVSPPEVAGSRGPDDASNAAVVVFRGLPSARSKDASSSLVRSVVLRRTLVHAVKTNTRRDQHSFRGDGGKG